MATCWTLAIAHASGVILPWSTLAAMFLAVWAIYAADRVLDSRDGTTSQDRLEARHLFHRRYWRLFLSATAVCTLLLAALVFSFERAELRLFSALGVLLFAYCLLIHARPSQSVRVPKEFAVGAFFAAALFIPTVARVPQLRPELLPVALLLAIVCTLNCTFIYAWEHEHSRKQAHWTTRIALGHTRSALCVVFGLATITCLWHPMLVHAPETAICLPASSLLFLLLHAARKRISKLDRRALIDFALLLPVGLVLLANILR